MPVAETIELAGRLRDETNVDLAAVVVNRVLPELFGRGEEEVFERLRAPAAGRRCSTRRPGRARRPCSTPPSWPCRCGGRRAEHLDDAARRRCRAEVPMLYVPELFARTLGDARCSPRWPRRWPRSSV